MYFSWEFNETVVLSTIEMTVWLTAVSWSVHNCSFWNWMEARYAHNQVCNFNLKVFTCFKVQGMHNFPHTVNCCSSSSQPMSGFSKSLGFSICLFKAPLPGSPVCSDWPAGLLCCDWSTPSGRKYQPITPLRTEKLKKHDKSPLSEFGV